MCGHQAGGGSFQGIPAFSFGAGGSVPRDSDGPVGSRSQISFMLTEMRTGSWGKEAGSREQVDTWKSRPAEAKEVVP